MSARNSRIAAAWAAIRGKQTEFLRASFRDQDGWLVQALVGAQNSSGQSVTPKSALGLTAYFACLRNISDDLAKTPIRMVEERGGIFTAVNKHQALTLVSDRPNPMMTPMDFWATIIVHHLGWHGGFAEIIHNDLDEPVELWPLDPTTVKVLWDVPNKTLLYEVKVGGSGKVIRLSPKNMFHIHGLGFDGFTSWVMADIARLSIGRALAIQEYSAAFFGNGATLKAVLEAPPTMTEKGMELLRDTFTMRHAGAGQAYKTPILPDGVTYREISTDPDKSQLTAAMHGGIEDVARLFRMPLNKIQHDIRSTFNNVTEMNKFYAHDTLSGPSRRICEEARLKLLTGPGDKNKRFKHDFSELLEADPKAQADVTMKQFQIGGWSINELRAKRGLKGIGKDGDRYYVMANLTPVDKVDAEPKPAPEPEEETETPTPDLEEEPPQETPENALSIDSPLIKDVIRLFRHDFRRFAKAEEDKALRKISQGRFDGWVKSYYPTRGEYVAQTLETRYRVLLGILRSEGSPETMSKRMSEEYVCEARERIVAGSRNEDIDTLDRFAGIMAVRAVKMALDLQEAA